MITKYIISLTALMTLSGASCWGAAQGDLDRQLIRAILFDYAEEVEQLITQGANVDSVDSNGNPAITMAIMSAQPRIINALIKAGANINAINNEGDTPLIVAVDSYKSDVIKALLQAGANSNIMDKSNKTALHHIILEMPLQNSQKYFYTEDRWCEFQEEKLRDTAQLLVDYMLDRGENIGDISLKLEAMGVEPRGG